MAGRAPDQQVDDSAGRSDGTTGSGRSQLLGVWVDALSIPELAVVLRRAVASGGPIVIGHANLHGVVQLHRNPPMAGFNEVADFTYIDGMP